MNSSMRDTIERFDDRRVLVIGEAILDTYLKGGSDRLCREAPVPIVSVNERTNAPGGAANTAVNVSALGAEVTFLSVIGEDPEGLDLESALAEAGVSTDYLIRRSDRRTLAKHRIIAESQLLVRYDQGTTDPIDETTERALLNHLTELFPRHDAVIISDYGYGILTRGVVRAIGTLQAETPRLLVVDSKWLATYRDVGVTAVKPNYAEAIRLLDLEPEEQSSRRADQIAAYETELLRVTGAQIVAVTLDTEGALMFERGQPPYRTYSQPRPHSRAAGAGDTFVSTLTLALAAGAHTPAAAELASAAASVVVGKDGTTACSVDELEAYLAPQQKWTPEWDDLRSRLAYYRRQDKRIVFTNGCFDILHRGHITYLNRAKSLGDVLIVGLNSDDSVRRLKGQRRPINTLEDRAQVLAGLSCVDHIVPFEDDTPRELIRLVEPDVFAKGGDYTHDTLPEAPLVEEMGGTVQILPYLEDVSTTSIIERIRTAYRPSGNGHVRIDNVRGL